MKQQLFNANIRHIIFILLFSLSLSIGAFAQESSKSANKPVLPADFKSDGCSMFPDCDYRACCVEHDKEYYIGGSWKQRWRSDKKLYKCVAAKKGFQHKIISSIMWLGVRAFAVPWLPTSFRWGFGKDEIRKLNRKRIKIPNSKFQIPNSKF
ncbi:hypothetical protein BH20ACI1_BH20ACI1_17050 [soil metagenome]